MSGGHVPDRGGYFLAHVAQEAGVSADVDEYRSSFGYLNEDVGERTRSSAHGRYLLIVDPTPVRGPRAHRDGQSLIERSVHAAPQIFCTVHGRHIGWISGEDGITGQSDLRIELRSDGGGGEVISRR